MTNSRLESFLEQARQLTPEEQVVALDALRAMVPSDERAWETAWAEEAEQRGAAFDQTPECALDFDSVMERLRNTFPAP